MDRIPLIVLGGFLGAGKTTLLNHLLHNAGGRRIAVLVNDFGPINVDAALISDHDGQTISLTNGCICCSIGSGLDAALIQVLERQPAPELIIIEASGVSDPGRIAQVGMSDPMMQLETVVVMVDTDQAVEQLDAPLLTDTISRQIDAAGLLVLNKTDLVSASKLSALKQRLAAQFGPIPVLHAQHGRLPLEALWNLPTHLERPALERSPEKKHEHAQKEHGHDHATTEHPFESGNWTGAGALNADLLSQALKQLPRSVIRVKGWVITDRHGPVIVHLAGRRVRFERRPSSPDTTLNSLVYIGLTDHNVPVIVEQALNNLLPCPAQDNT